MSEKIWFVTVNRQQLEGQHTAEEVRTLRSEQPDSKFLVWKPGMAQWADADTIEELKPPTPAPKPAEPAPPPSTPAPPPSSPAPPSSAAPPPERPAPSPPPSSRPEPEPARSEPPAARPRPSAPPASSSPRRSMPSSSGGREAVLEQAGFFKGLLDFSFTHFITPQLMKVLYVIVMALIALGVLFMIGAGLLSIVSAFRFQSFMPALMGIVQIVLAPVFGLLYLAFVRVLFEVAMVLFSIKDSTKEMVRALDQNER